MLKKILTITYNHCRTTIAALAIILFATINAASSPGMTADGLLNLDLKVFIAAKPVSLILVEKNSHGLKVLRHDGRLQVTNEFRVALGENFGRKEKEGDEKTPEGIYFITKKYIDHKVTVFGTRAFHLNYPNIFDTLEERDGNGIYIHGTNKALRYNSTNGCVSLNDHDLARLANVLKVGTMPVIIVQSLLELKTNAYDRGRTAQAVLPDLTSDNFALAKKLLMPEGISPKVKFDNLYMLRVNDQTVVAGEYGSSNFAASYIKFYPQKGWAVLERVPNFLSGENYTAPVAGQPPTEFLAEKTTARADNKIASNTASDNPTLWSWPPREKDVFLSWYRDSLQHRQNLSHIPQAKKNRPNPSPAAKTAKSNGLIYGLALICLLLAVSLIIIASRLRKVTKTAVGTLQDSGTTPIVCDGRQIVIDNKICQRQTATLQNDVRFLKDALQTLLTHLEETRLMDKEELQTRIDDLESGLQEKKAEIEQLITEKAALKLKGMSHLSGQVEELGVMRQELRASQEKLDESRQDLERLPMLEQMLTAEQEKSQQLAIKNAALKNGESSESAALQTEITSLSEELGILKEKLRTSEAEQQIMAEKIAAGTTQGVNEEELRRIIAEEQRKNSLLSEKLADISNVEAELKDDGSKLLSEIAGLREELGVMKEKVRASEAEQQALEDKIAASVPATVHEEEMRRMITGEQHKNSILSEKLGGFAAIEAELKEELAASRKQNNELSARIENLAMSHSELSRTGEEKTTNFLVLQKELDIAQQEIAQLTVQIKRNNDLEDLLLARQVEVTKLTNDLQEFRELTTEQHKADVAALRIQQEGLREDLLAESARRQEAEQQLAEILAEKEHFDSDQRADEGGEGSDSVQRTGGDEEIVAQPESAVEISSPPAPLVEHIDEVPEPVAEVAETSESSDLLPQDILAKWLNN
jgi:hypothetical protein